MKLRYLLLFFPIALFGQAQLDSIPQWFAAKQYMKAQEVMAAYVRTNPNDVKGIELLGDAYGHQKKWDEAIRQYRKLTRMEPNNANYHYKYGGALGMKALTVSKLNALPIVGDVKASFLKAAELDAKHIGTRWALVELYLQLPGILGGSHYKSLKYAEELQRLSPVDGYLAKGHIYETEGDYALAETHYKKAIAVGRSLHCYGKLTTLYETSGQHAKAIANLEATLNKFDYQPLHYQIGKLAAEHQVALDKGVNHLVTYLQKPSIAGAPTKAWTQFRLAQIYRHKGDRVKALQHMDLALAESPKNKFFEAEKAQILNLR